MGFGIGSLISAGASIAGSLIGGKSSENAADKNAAMQREFAQNGIRWKVEDAKAAGIHPLYALGAQTHSFSPSYVGGDYSGVGIAGQEIGRAIDQGRTQSERTAARLSSLQIERGELENALLRSQISKLNANSTPPMPDSEGRYLIPGQSSTHMGAGLVQPQAASPVNAAVGNPAREAGEVTDYGYARTQDGYTIVPSMDVKDRIEDAIIPELQWSMRNLHLFPPRMKPPTADLPPSYDYWRWHPVSQEFRPARSIKQAYRNFTGSR